MYKYIVQLKQTTDLYYSDCLFCCHQVLIFRLQAKGKLNQSDNIARLHLQVEKCKSHVRKHALQLTGFFVHIQQEKR